MPSGVLASEFSRGYELFEDQIVHDVDGSVIRDLRDLSALLDEARKEFVTITQQRGNGIVLNRAEVEAASGVLLACYRIPADRSPDLVRAAPAESARSACARAGERRFRTTVPTMTKVLRELQGRSASGTHRG